MTRNSGNIADALGRLDRRAERAKEEARRLAGVKARGDVDADCSDEIVPAPARGSVKSMREVHMVPVGTDDFKEVEERYKAGTPGMVRDVFDDMTDQALRCGGTAPFTAAQVDAGRTYGALTERVEAAGVKCSQAFDVQTGGSGQTDFLTAYMTDRQRLRRFHNAIGNGIALPILRKSSGEALTRRAIFDRVLVDRVCLQDQSLSEVLAAHHWQNTGKTIKRLRMAFCLILERMHGI
ncbi:hypothetical protein [Pseudaestuariivita rosea]|uniref:hypothetical protein n=1 Tax=Pseudaestuariivita rosea TaxID=2763263 RepID=UPI001ABB2192|nr:hypothetical protein [Pseudaestuariivita rosea]